MGSEAFAIEMEGEARRLAKMMESAKRGAWKAEGNVKPWYNPRWMFNQGAERVFLGINPGGDPGNPDGTAERHVCADPDSHGEDGAYNSWLCEYWGARARSGSRKPNPHQAAVWLAFEALYGETEWEDALKRAPTFNVCPLRTRGAWDIPPNVWESSSAWCNRVIHELRPTTIICNGNGETSPWSVLHKTGNLESTAPARISKSTNLKRGIYTHNEAESDVIGIPSLSRFASTKLYEELSEVKPADLKFKGDVKPASE